MTRVQFYLYLNNTILIRCFVGSVATVETLLKSIAYMAILDVLGRQKILYVTESENTSENRESVRKEVNAQVQHT